MALRTQFERTLNKLFSRRTASLRASIGRRRSGRAPTFNKRRVRPVIETLVKTARQIIVESRAKREFFAAVAFKRKWYVTKRKGFGRRAKKAAFRRWYARKVHSSNCVYVLWSSGTCEYVGRTIRGKGRPSGSIDRWWFGHVTRIDVYAVRSPAVVPKVECLAIHLFDPRRNVNSAARPKFARKCPICSTEKEIRLELKRIFPFRKNSRR